MEKLINEMTDIEFVDYWIDNSVFINPILLRELCSRDLYDITNLLQGKNKAERRSEARARLAAAGRYIGDPEIEKFAGVVDRIKFLQKRIEDTNPTDFMSLEQYCNDLKGNVDWLKNYFK